MIDNWYALYVAIIKKVSVEKAIKIMKIKKVNLKQK